MLQLLISLSTGADAVLNTTMQDVTVQALSFRKDKNLFYNILHKCPYFSLN